MTVISRRLLALSFILPMLAVGAFTFAPRVEASCSSSPSQCCYAGTAYQLGDCVSMGGCWWYTAKCAAGGVDAYWDNCSC